MQNVHVTYIMNQSFWFLLLGISPVSPLEPEAYKSDIQLHITWFWWEYQSALGAALVFLTECNRVSAVIRPEGQWTRRNVSPDNMLWPSSAFSRFGVNSRWQPERKDETHNLRLYGLWQGLCWARVRVTIWSLQFIWLACLDTRRGRRHKLNTIKNLHPYWIPEIMCCCWFYVGTGNLNGLF